MAKEKIKISNTDHCNGKSVILLVRCLVIASITNIDLIKVPLKLNEKKLYFRNICKKTMYME